MQQLERYVRIILDCDASADCLVGIGFPTTRRFKSIKATLDDTKGREFPSLWRLHTAGKLLYLVCGGIFVTSAATSISSDTSSESGSLKKIENLLVGLIRAMLVVPEDEGK